MIIFKRIKKRKLRKKIFCHLYYPDEKSNFPLITSKSSLKEKKNKVIFISKEILLIFDDDLSY